jgi:hypothetical protein
MAQTRAVMLTVIKKSFTPIQTSRHIRVVTTALVAVLALSAKATPDQGLDCASCHDIAQTGMSLANFQTTTNLGAGLRKVFRVSPGNTAVIQLNVTNDYGGNYGLSIDNLGAAGGNNASDHMAYTADPAWTSRSSATYFTVGPVGTSPDLWTFNLGVKTNTPVDYYMVQTQLAGSDSNNNLWSQQEAFYVQVMPAAAPAPSLLAPHRSSGSFSVQVATTSGFTYFLEYKTALSATGWNPAAQTPGDGRLKTLTDTTASDLQRFYRVRVQ